MKIPYRIDPLILSLYERSKDTSDLISEQGILIDAQDLKWDDDEIPTLVDLCVKKIAFYFDEHPWFYEVPCANRDDLLELLSLDLDLELTIPLLKSEYYWKRRYEKHFGEIIIPKPKVWTWKSLYIERETQRMIETAQPSSKDEEKLESMLKLCCPYVKRLLISQLQMWKPPLACNPDTIPEIWPVDHIDLTCVLPHLQLIEELDVVFGQNQVYFGFHWNMFKVTVLDCQRLGKAILSLPNLTLLRIHKSMIEDKQCQALMQSLVDNKSIVELHLPNCDIGDDGCLCLAKFLLECPTLKILNLSNNRIKERGTVGLAYSLLQPQCPPLVSLFLNLNPLGREGVVGIMRALVRCTLPEELYISAVQFSGDVIERIAQMITNNNSLKVLDMSSNYFGEIGGKMTIEAMESNTCLEWVDMRETGITEEQQTAITRLLRRNRGVPLDVEDEDDEMQFELSDDGKQADEDEDEL